MLHVNVHKRLSLHCFLATAATEQGCPD